MSCYYLYADESGTMPLEDDDGPFVGGIVGTRAPILVGAGLRGSPQFLIQYLKKAQATPWLCHVRPQVGYGDAVRTKFSKMDTMARARRLVTGEHAYLPDNGFSTRNLIWGHCVTQTVPPLLVSEVFKAPIDALEVVFDEKTLASGERQMFIDRCREIPRRLMEALTHASARAPTKVKPALANMLLKPSAVSVRWSDDPTVAGAEHGLRLAHWLARHHLRHLLKPSKPSFQDLLSAAGWPGHLMDVTCFVTTPPPPDVIEKWKRDTGLPEPTCE